MTSTVSSIELPGRPLPSLGGEGSSAQAESTQQFVFGPENQVLADVVQRLLEGPLAGGNPLVLCGPSGVGKSHLAYGLAQHWRKRGPETLVCCETSLEFSANYSLAMQEESVVPFRNQYLNLSLWIVEGLEQLENKPGCQAEMVRIIDDLLDAGGQVIVTSVAPPHGMEWMIASLRSRLVGGLTLSIAKPATQTRLALLEQFADDRDIALPAEAASLLAGGLQGGTRELIGALLHMEAVSRLEHREIAAKDARSYLRDGRSSPAQLLSRITREVAKYFDLTVADLKSASRRRNVVQARGVAMLLARELTGMSHGQLGRAFGGRDHTTALHAWRATQNKMEKDPALALAVEELRMRLTGT